MALRKIGAVLTKEMVAYTRLGSKSLLTAKPLKVNTFKYAPIKSDSIVITNPANRIYASLQKRIISAGTEDELIVLGHEIDKFKENDVLKKRLQSEYFAKYRDFYKNHYTGQNISAHNLFKEMYGKNLTEEDAEALRMKYEAILKEPDFDKYLDKLFIQVKKDLGIDYLPIELEKEVMPDSGVGVQGGTSIYMNSLWLAYYKDNPVNRHKLFGLIIHELTHAKQIEIAIGADDNAYLKMLASTMQKKSSNKDKSIEDLMQTAVKKIGPDTLSSIRSKYGKADKNSELYKRGISYIDGIKNHKGVKEYTGEYFRRYKQQLIEKEAYAVQSSAYKLYSLLAM